MGCTSKTSDEKPQRLITFSILKTGLTFFYAPGLIRSCIATKILESVDENGLKVWQCVDCGFARKKKSVIVYHVEYKHLKQNLPCQHCGKLFANEHALKKHLKSHELVNTVSHY